MWFLVISNNRQKQWFHPDVLCKGCVRGHYGMWIHSKQMNHSVKSLEYKSVHVLILPLEALQSAK